MPEIPRGTGPLNLLPGGFPAKQATGPMNGSGPANSQAQAGPNTQGNVGGTPRMAGDRNHTGKLDPKAISSLSLGTRISSPVKQAANEQIKAYQEGYAQIEAKAQADAAATGGMPDEQNSTPYVVKNDPLKSAVAAPKDGDYKAAFAEVSLGVNPGDFFCGGQTKALADCKAQAAEQGVDLKTGFLHIPPDGETGDTVSANLPSRKQNMEMTAHVVGDMVKGVAKRDTDAKTTVLLTGFTEFEGVKNNPTEAFVKDAAGNANKENLDKVMQHAFPGFEPNESNTAAIPGADGKTQGYAYQVGGNQTVNLMTGTMNLNTDRQAAFDGHYFEDMGGVQQQFDKVMDGAKSANGGQFPDAAISLGVDGGQWNLGANEQARYKIETQGRGFAQGKNVAPTPNTDMAQIMLEDKGRSPDAGQSYAKDRESAQIKLADGDKGDPINAGYRQQRS